MRLESSVAPDAITKEISEMFDYEFSGSSSFDVPQMPSTPSDFAIGLIVGPSGSGKSSILNSLGGVSEITWQRDKAIVSHFNDSSEAQEKLSAVGFNSIPSWLRPYHALSTGEKFRADLAASLYDGAIIDEFTSVVDRNVAKSCSAALRRYVDSKGLKKIVMASCHYDIIEWLEPDWVFDTATKKLSLRGSLRRPSIELEILPCTSAMWPMFSEHHYLSGEINKSSHCWAAIWDGNAVGFSAVIAMPSGSIKNAWREHRVVVLPDYQGLGLGVRISEAVAEIHLREGKRFFSKTAHPRLGQYRDESLLWRGTSKNHKKRDDYKKQIDNGKYSMELKNRHASRVCYSHEYIGTKEHDQ